MRRRVVVLFVVLISFIAVGCDIQTVRPGGSDPLRYRDEIFPTVTKTSNVVYGSAVNESGATQSLALDVYRPAGDTVTSRPAIVWVHGGGFSGGSRNSAEIVDQANTFARKGYVTVSITYRLSSTGCSAGAPTIACVTAIINAKHDAQAAVRFLRANAATYGVDANRIAIGGSSAGAITALNVGYDSSDVGSSGNPGFSSQVDAAVSLSGARILGTYSSEDAASLLFHGTSDFVVPYQWAVNTVDGAKAAGLQSYLTTWTGAGHVPYLANRTQIIDETTNFLYWTMDLYHAAT
jgi:carboxylesterase type B